MSDESSMTDVQDRAFLLPAVPRINYIAQFKTTRASGRTTATGLDETRWQDSVVNGVVREERRGEETFAWLLRKERKGRSVVNRLYHRGDASAFTRPGIGWRVKEKRMSSQGRFLRVV
ncbi:Uncharacterized protein DBV15_03178 [Temnothorax longispinosus]|uniref:Uncharacterized protein n=1 Tax=Temnothorax longispinosus TaxID=300112 RepID=A0A4S2KP78_9HYME|nr:Uncharacterized protein DBV15_03178 [Temnothorax longispinosus]